MDWWQTFFDEQYLKLYEPTLTAERTEREVQGIISALDLKSRARVLDLCCGQGRHAVRLAQEGYRVTGLDLSSHLLAAARQAAEAAGVELALVQGDMREIPFRAKFDAIVNLFTAFGYFDADEENARVLHGVARALKPGGKFLIDIRNMCFTSPLAFNRMWYEAPIGPVFQEYSWDPWTGRDNNTHNWFENGERKSRSFSVRVYAPHEMVSMLRSVGLQPVKLYGGFDLKDYKAHESRRLMILAQKEG
jgi:SAM-dependent methyltransferase